MFPDYTRMRSSTNYLSLSFDEQNFEKDLNTMDLSFLDEYDLLTESSSANSSESSSISTPEESANEINNLVFSGVLILDTSSSVTEATFTKTSRDEQSIPVQTQETTKRKRTYTPKSKSPKPRKKTKTQQPRAALTPPTQPNPPLNTFQNVRTVIETMRAAKESAESQLQASSKRNAELEQEVASLKQKLEPLQQQDQALQMFSLGLENFIQKFRQKLPDSSLGINGLKTTHPINRAEETIYSVAKDLFRIVDIATLDRQQLLNEITLLNVEIDAVQPRQ